MKVCIISSRPIGEKCRAWALGHLPPDWHLTDTLTQADIIISVLFREIIIPEILNGRVAYNFHAGKLPEYRGSGSFIWAIINGEKQTAVTLHQIDSGIDTGPIVKIMPFTIKEKDTPESLMQHAEDLIFSLFIEYFPKMLKFQVESFKQDEAVAKTYFRKDLEKAKDLTRFVRAMIFEDKEKAFFINAKGQKIYLDYYAS